MKTKFKLNKKLYTKESILTTTKAYSKICKTKTKIGFDYFKITLQSKGQTEPKLKYEFCNHCLSLVKLK